MKKILLVVMLAALAGCASQPTVPVYKYQNVVTLLPKSYTGHCVVKTKPPIQKDYILATPQGRIDMLLAMNAGLLVDIKTCNDRWDQVDIWNASELSIYGNDPTAVFPGQAPALPAVGASAAAVSK